MNWIKNLNATPRLMLGFGILLILSVGIGVLAISRLIESNTQLGDLYRKDMRGAILASDLGVLKMELARQDRDAMLHMKDPKAVAADEKVIQTDLVKFKKDIDTAENILTAKEALAMVHTLQEETPGYEAGILAILDRVHAGDLAGAEAGLAKMQAQAKPMNKAVESLAAFEQKKADEKFHASNRTLRSSIWLVVTALASAICLGIVLSIVIAHTFSIPLQQAVSALQQVADGDLAVSLDLDTGDEMGAMAKALNDALYKLRSTLQDVSANAAQASASSQELAEAADSIATGAQDQAASLEETSASLEQITATMQQSADNAKLANTLAADSRESAERGQQVVLSAVTAMEEINVASAKISDIIGTIDEIAFQTNLLAVNAAVEAARAGQEGRGFAVVATEVRSLALRSAGAAKQIKGLIKDSLAKVDRGSALVNRSGETLRGIVSSANQVTEIVAEMSSASREQSIGIDQVNTAVTQIDQVTQANSSRTVELSSTARSLMEQSVRLTELLGTFTLSKGENERDSDEGIDAASGWASPSSRPATGASRRGPHRINKRLEPEQTTGHPAAWAEASDPAREAASVEEF